MERAVEVWEERQRQGLYSVEETEPGTLFSLSHIFPVFSSWLNPATLSYDDLSGVLETGKKRHMGSVMIQSELRTKTAL